MLTIESAKITLPDRLRTTTPSRSVVPPCSVIPSPLHYELFNPDLVSFQIRKEITTCPASYAAEFVNRRSLVLGVVVAQRDDRLAAKSRHRTAENRGTELRDDCCLCCTVPRILYPCWHREPPLLCRFRQVNRGLTLPFTAFALA